LGAQIALYPQGKSQAAEEQDMRLDCPRCHSVNLSRLRRRGMLDHIRAQFGRWPFCCRNCGRHFRASQRYPAPPPEQHSRANEREARDQRFSGPQMAYRSDPIRPTARIVLQTDDHAQMNQILLALDRVVSSYQQPVKTHAGSAAR